MPFAIIHKEVLQGYVGPLRIFCGDNAAVGSTAVERRYLAGGESVSSATASCTAYPTGATIGSGGDLELGTVAAGASTVEINGEVVTSGEWFSIAATVKATAILGTYTIEGNITTSASRTLPYVVYLIVNGAG